MSNYANIIIQAPKDVVITEQKIKIAQLVADDVHRKDIAKKMKLSIRTIEAHLDSMRYLLGVKSTPALIASLFRRNVLK
jgi:DNA-binding CsgD family transcriptional regulator